MSFTGLSFIGNRRGAAGGAVFTAFNPATGEALPGDFHSASAAEVAEAVELAHAAFPAYSALSGKARAEFLRKIAANIEALGAALTERACLETALPEGRIKGETGRTCGQLRLFADLIADGSWVDARIDHALPDRQPVPKPDLRCMSRPLGPVAVFGASNFPLAYSTAGGDTASALAVGCPVVVKAHPSHPGTGELVASAICQAVEDCGLPPGVFSMVYDAGHDAGRALVIHPEIKAVGFTGSRAGGRALMDLAAARPEPIPVYAEMSSVNPVVLLPGALTERAAALAAGLAGSVTLGCGQFCTNPGLVIYDHTAADIAPFLTELQRLLGAAPPATMLSESICRNYGTTRSRLASHPAVTELACVSTDARNAAGAALYQTTAAAVLADPALTAEVFGPSTLLVAAGGPAELLALVDSLEGQLTASAHGTPDDFAAAAPLLAALERRSGRLICNGWPTGVEVCPSIVHGGPYPATSDGRSTSVGTAAVYRFVRPVAWQGFPDALLPPELQEANPLGIPRIVDGVRS